MLFVSVIILIVAAVVGLQVLPRPILDLANPAWKNLRENVPINAPDRVSVTATVPWLSFGYGLLFALSFGRAFLLARNAETARTLLKALSYAGVCYALFGIFSHVLTPNLLLWRPKQFYLDFATGTFVNRNTAATYWGSCSLIFVIQFIRAVLSNDSHRSTPFPFFQRASVLGASCVICLVAVGMTGSRAGILVTLLSMVFASILYLAPWNSGRSLSWGLGFGLIALALVVFVFIGGSAMSRMSMFGLSDVQRAEVYRTSFDMIQQHKVLGFGLGNFEMAFPSYRPGSLGSEGIWDRAHSTPIELMVGLGLPAAFLIFAAATLVFLKLLAGSLMRKRDRHIPVIGAGVAVLGVMHSLVDFSLQIPGYGVVFAAVVGCGLAQSTSSSARRHENKNVAD